VTSVDEEEGEVEDTGEEDGREDNIHPIAFDVFFVEDLHLPKLDVKVGLIHGEASFVDEDPDHKKSHQQDGVDDEDCNGGEMIKILLILRTDFRILFIAGRHGEDVYGAGEEGIDVIVTILLGNGGDDDDGNEEGNDGPPVEVSGDDGQGANPEGNTGHIKWKELECLDELAHAGKFEEHDGTNVVLYGRLDEEIEVCEDADNLDAGGSLAVTDGVELEQQLRS